MTATSERFTLIATTAFGLESIVVRELKALGYENLEVQDGMVRFQGDARAVCRANLWLRCSDRILIEVGQFSAMDFGELFDQTTALPWERWIPIDAQFPVKGKSVRSQLHSTPHCQSISKKAIVERLKGHYGVEWLEETAQKITVQCSIKKDIASLTIDTSGRGLHKRGYRRLKGKAPLKETLASALVQLSYWNPDRLLVDPLCGSGTILIEAAMLGRNIAPGLKRGFDAEIEWDLIPESLWEEEREKARDAIQPNFKTPLLGYDRHEKSIEIAQRNALSAGVADDITFEVGELKDFRSNRDYGCLITNPPYGERLGDIEEAEETYELLGRQIDKLDNWSSYVIASHPKFESFFGKKADRRRKLYNAMIACTYFQYQGPKPPWS